MQLVHYSRNATSCSERTIDTVKATAPSNPVLRRILKRGIVSHGPDDPAASLDSPAVRDGSLQTVGQYRSGEVKSSGKDGQMDLCTAMDVPIPSDAQMLYWTLIDDGSVPDGFLADFMVSMRSVESTAARKTRATFLDNPQADLFVHEFHKKKSGVATEEKSSADAFSQAYALPPRRYKTRLERTPFSGPTPRKDA